METETTTTRPAATVLAELAALIANPRGVSPYPNKPEPDTCACMCTDCSHCMRLPGARNPFPAPRVRYSDGADQ